MNFRYRQQAKEQQPDEIYGAEPLTLQGAHYPPSVQDAGAHDSGPGILTAFQYGLCHPYETVGLMLGLR